MTAVGFVHNIFPGKFSTYFGTMAVEVLIKPTRTNHKPETNMGSGCSSPSVVVPALPTVEPGSPWILWSDDEDIEYYYNFRTGAYTQEERQCDWHQCYDEYNSAYYWANSATGETSWNGPCQPPELPLLFQAMNELMERYSIVPANQNPEAEPVAGVPVARPSDTGAVGSAEQPVAMAVPVYN